MGKICVILSAIILTIVGFGYAATGLVHGVRNVYLDTATDRTPIPLGGITKMVRKDVSVDAGLDNDPHKYIQTVSVRVQNDSSIPIWNLSVRCRARYDMDDSSDHREETYVLFQDTAIMPGQSRTDTGVIRAGGGNGVVSCSVKDIKTPIPWWNGAPKSMDADF